MGRKLTRRDFIRMGVLGAAATVLAGCKWPRRWEVLEPYVKPPEEQLAGEATWYATTCRQCPAGCGVIVRVMNGRALKLEGNPEHPLNQGKLCARGQAGLQVLYNPDRLSGPETQGQRGSRGFQTVGWDAGVQQLSAKLQAAGSGVAVWMSPSDSGHLYDLFLRFLSAIGAPKPLVFDLYTAYHGYFTLQQANQQATGQATLPEYNLANADVVFSFGADFAGTWLSATRYGLEFGRFRSQALGQRGLLVQFEPNMTPSGAKADRWVPIRPGSGGLVAGAIARLIADQKYGSAERIDRAGKLAGSLDVNAAAQAADVSVDQLKRLAQIFAQAKNPVALPGSALSGMAGAADASAAVLALNLIAGASTASARLDDTLAKAFLKPPVSGMADVEELIRAMGAGQVKVLLVHGANPLYDLPQKQAFLDALKQVPFVVSFASIADETSAWADLVLPDRTYLESWGYDVTSPSFGVQAIGSQQPVVTPVYDNRATADVLLAAAKEIPAAASALAWKDEVEFLKEVVAQLPNNGNKDLGWAQFLQHGGWWQSAPASPAAPATPAGAAAAPVNLAPPQYEGSAIEFPFFLQISMSELLSDGRGANQPWLQGSPDVNTTIAWQTWLEMNPVTAQKLGLQLGDLVKVSSPYGSIEAPVYFFPAIRPDTVAVPLGQGHSDYGRYAKGRGANALALVNPQQGGGAPFLNWSALRVKIERIGRRMRLAGFEGVIGLTQALPQGFPNKGNP